MPDQQFRGPVPRVGRLCSLDDGFRGGPGPLPGAAVPKPTPEDATPAAKGLEVFDVLTDALTRHGGEPRGSYGEGSARIFRELVDGGVGGRAILAMTIYGDPLKERHVGRARAMGRPALRAGIDPETTDRLTSVFDQSLPENAPPNRRARVTAALVDMSLLDMRDGISPDSAIRRTSLLLMNDRLRDLVADRGPLSPVIPHDPPAPWQAPQQSELAGSMPTLRRIDFDAVQTLRPESSDDFALVGPGSVNTDAAVAAAPRASVDEPTFPKRLFTRIGEAAIEAFRGEIGISEESFRWLQEAGLFRRGDETPFGPIATVRQFNEIFLGGGAAAVDLTLRPFEALANGGVGGIAQLAEEFGMDPGDAGRLERDLLAMVALGTRRGGPRSSMRKGPGTDGDTSKSSSGMKNKARVEEGRAVDLMVRLEPRRTTGMDIEVQPVLPGGKRPDGIDWGSKTIIEVKVKDYKRPAKARKQANGYLDVAWEHLDEEFTAIIMQPVDSAFDGLTESDVANMTPAQRRRLLRRAFKIIEIIDKKNKK